ncbi:ATP-binding protein [Endozoicomonas atrinae]|uniref:ATP-binding protein n=1 Tax=Endozoicomonas atrinae TaxID=1333660 RepID=UPI0008262DEE|nr:ATP-binding protein [Endozoicomonas atrinae]
MSDLFESETQLSTLSFEDLFSTGQIRLAEISVYNWGSFNQLHTGSINPDGTLITGDNGSGKSTFIDGLMALLLPAGKASFNVAAAQGDRSDRSLISYIRGSYGTEHDGTRTNTLNKRPGSVVSGLRALYRAEDGSEITLAALFWMTQNSNALRDVNRLYLVGKRNIELQELLQGFSSGNARQLKRQLSDDQTIAYYGESHAAYEAVYRQLLRMDNKNAPALLSRALGLKKIDDLTDLIRKLVLEPSKIQNDARKAVEGFDDLVRIHGELQTARSQRDRLLPLPGCKATFDAAKHQSGKLSAQLSGLPVWFGEQRHHLWTQRIKSIEQKIFNCETELRLLTQKEKDAKDLERSRYDVYIQAGGSKIEQLKKELERNTEKLSEVNVKAQNYQTTSQRLALKTDLKETAFADNAKVIEQRCNNLDEERQRLQDAFGAAAGQFSESVALQTSLEEEIREIEALPDSNIDRKYQQLRDELSTSLDIPKSELMFIGELVDVHPEHKKWQGAIERALGGLRTTLAVPEKSYHLVTRWLNHRHTGLHVRVQVVRSNVSGNASFKTDGYLRKLKWREHPYREWLKHHLARFDMHCVDSTEMLDKTPFSMTEQGLMHLEHGRFEKKDQQPIHDRRVWQLGFSNKDRLALLQQDLKNQIEQVKSLEEATNLARKALNQAGEMARLWMNLKDFTWDAINVPYWQQKVEQCKNELEDLQKAGGDLDTAKRRWEDARDNYEAAQNDREQKSKGHAVLESQKESAESARDKAGEAASCGLEDGVRIALQERIGDLVDDDLDNSIGLQEEHQQEIGREKEKASGVAESASRQAVGIMSAFSTEWKHITEDWLKSIEGLSDFIQYLEKLETEGLPELVDRFRERLNRHTTQSLANINQQMISEREEIEERILTINQVLARTEFKHGSHLRLGAKAEEFEHVKLFKKQLRSALEQANSEDHEARYDNLQKIIAVLEKATASVTANNLESLRLLDSRYQLSFYAEEIDNETHKVLDVLASSTGKSGGEKESFAGTIVAASLAYVLTPDGHDKPIYSTVFLDEAFSNTAESVSRRVLKVFRELNIHINLITPYKNLNLARESAKSLLIAERDSKVHESKLCEVTWAEIDRRMKEHKTLKSKIKALDIEIEPVVGEHL